MTYIYILQSVDGEPFHVGGTEELRGRPAKHNAGEVRHTRKFAPWRMKRKFAPWRMKIYVAVSDPKQA